MATFYEFNQQNYHALPNMPENAFEGARDNLVEWLENHKSTYYMLLNNDKHYYTVFVNKTNWTKGLANEVISIARELGNVKSIEKSNDNAAYELWISDDETCHCYFLFDYTQGVIEI